MNLARSWNMNRNVVSAAAAALVLAAAPLAAQVSAPGNNKPLPPSAQKAPPFQQGGGGFNGLLQGEYIYSGSGACIVVFGEFSENFQPLAGGFTNDFTVNGIRIFNGDGTGTVDARSMVITPGPASSSRFTTNFTYHVAGDLSIEIRHELSTIQVLTGPNAGQTQVLHGPIVMKGWITEDLSTIHVMQYDPQIETATVDGEILNKRICARDRTMTRLKRAR